MPILTITGESITSKELLSQKTKRHHPKSKKKTRKKPHKNSIRFNGAAKVLKSYSEYTDEELRDALKAINREIDYRSSVEQRSAAEGAVIEEWVNSLGRFRKISLGSNGYKVERTIV